MLMTNTPTNIAVNTKRLEGRRKHLHGEVADEVNALIKKSQQTEDFNTQAFIHKLLVATLQDAGITGVIGLEHDPEQGYIYSSLSQSSQWVIYQAISRELYHGRHSYIFV